MSLSLYSLSHPDENSHHGFEKDDIKVTGVPIAHDIQASPDPSPIKSSACFM